MATVALATALASEAAPATVQLALPCSRAFQVLSPALASAPLAPLLVPSTQSAFMR